MKIDEAIKLLNELDKGCGPLDMPKYEKALKLGEEALKRVQERRKLKYGWELMPLPGETEE